MTTTVLNVGKIIDSPSALTREQGLLLQKEIIPCLNNNEKVVLDCSEIESSLTPFWNVSIGKLYDLFDEDMLSSHLSIIHEPEGTKSKLRLVISNAKQFYSNGNEFASIVKKAGVE